MKNYQYILFDLDGTLTNPKEGITKSVQYALQHFGIEENNLDELLCFIGPPLRHSFKEYYGFDEEKAERAVEKYRERYREEGLFENRVYEGIEELLHELKCRGKTLAIATSKPEIFSKRIVEKYNLGQYFKILVGSELDGTRDDKAEVIKEVLRQLEIGQERKEEVLMIGDRMHDINGASCCGIDSVGVYYGFAKENELEENGATYVVHTVKELKELLCDE